MKTLIKNIQPQNPIEESIKNDILEYLEFSNEFISGIQSELKEDPENWDYTIDDFNHFLFTYKIQ